MNRMVGFGFSVVALLPIDAVGQLQRDHDTMIPAEKMRAIATEISGSRAYENVLDLAAYEHIRSADEYTGTYREAAVAERLAKEVSFRQPEVQRR